MSATALTQPRAARTRALAWPRTTVVRALVLSRLIVFGAGAIASTEGHRMRGWRAFDPHGLSAGMGPVGNALSAVSVRWDAIYYLEIARSGYRVAGDAVFFPLYPLLIRLGALLTGSAVSAGILISLVAFAVALTLLHRLTEIELGARAADATVLLLAFAPLSLFFSAVYTESLFLALSVGALYAARRGRWLTAAALAALATITRVPGLLVTVPIAWMLWRSPARSWRHALPLLAPPAALAGFLAYLAHRGFGWLAPLTGQMTIEHMHVLVGPFATLGFATMAAIDGVRSAIGGTPVLVPTIGGPFSFGFESVLLFAELLVALIALVLAFRRLPGPYALYALLMLLVCVFSPVILQPLEGFDRYLLVIFPLTMAAGAWLAERRLLPVAVLFGACALAFYAFEFAAWAFLG